MWRLVADLLDERGRDLRAEATEHEDREVMQVALAVLVLAEVARAIDEAQRREAA